ncbi:tubulin-specific chaperone cofactor E-like protein isoform X2 [Ostrea edulis]|uniref:tubulin-specific chaperone cofactor E-like protein isoform X2 n=1 Tax=Ostrea edulis TaxID=37623 RepID=UPI0024AF67BB|nr:tubulin-specific chaperone cofactor E-like protein isoform X2 [Ostrea edulis]
MCPFNLDPYALQKVLCLMDCMPKLQVLNLCANALDNDSWPGDDNRGTFTALQNLILNNTGVSWDVTHNFLRLCPSLTEMHLSLNEHEDISLPNPLQTYPTVKKIHMSKNKIKHWSQLHKVGRLFPNLENFVNIESDLENLRSPIEEENDMAQIFSKMKTLVLTQTKLGRWEDLERLRHCPALVDLKVLGIPFLEEIAVKPRRQQLVSRLPNIQCLNGTPISECEREDAERAFIRMYMDSEEKPSRYFELENIYGRLDPLAEVDMSVATILNLALDIAFQGREERIEINTDQKVKDMMKTISNIVGIPASKMKVYQKIVCKGQLIQTVLMSTFPNKKLWTYYMSTEDIIVCELKTTPKPCEANIHFV